jgi:hypothetical protein
MDVTDNDNVIQIIQLQYVIIISILKVTAVKNTIFIIYKDKISSSHMYTQFETHHSPMVTV